MKKPLDLKLSVILLLMPIISFGKEELSKPNYVYQMSEDRLLDLDCWKRDGTFKCMVISVEYHQLGKVLKESYIDGLEYEDSKKEGQIDEVLASMFENARKSKASSPKFAEFLEGVEILIQSKNKREFKTQKKLVQNKSKGLCSILARPISGVLLGSDLENMKSEIAESPSGCKTQFILKNNVLRYESSGKDCKEIKIDEAKTIVNFEHKYCTSIAYIGN